MGLFDKFKAGLAKTRQQMNDITGGMMYVFRKIDDDVYDELEEALIMSDAGYETSSEIIEKLRERAKEKRITDTKALNEELCALVADFMDGGEFDIPTPVVILVIGVNGVGKTTSIGKLAKYYTSQGKSVMLAAADTFRAAAAEQLDIWAKRVGVDIVKQQEGTDPASVVFDSVCAAKSRGKDILICDTAGRLHNKKNLMDELKKINKVIEREFPNAHKEVFLVLDATTGQNAVIQAKNFSEAADITGIVLTKLDGTA